MSKYSRLGRSARHWIRAHYKDLAEIPPPEETWTAKDYDVPHGYYQKMRQLCIIERVREHPDTNKRTEWRTRRPAYELIQDLTDESV